MKVNVKNKLFIIIAVVIVLIVSLAVFFQKKQETDLKEKITEVELINVADYQNGNATISAFGQVESMNQVDLKSQVSGNLKSVKVKIGDQVTKDQLLIEIDHDILDVQLDQAKATVDRLNNSLDLKIAGATDEQINISQAQLDSAKVALEKAEKNLADVTKLTDESLKSKYNYGASSLDDANIKIYNSYTAIDSIRNGYFNSSDQQGLRVESILTNQLSKARDGSKNVIAKLNSDDYGLIDSSINQMINYLDTVLASLTEIRDMCDKNSYKNSVPDTVRASIDSQKAIISASKNAITALKNEIAVLKTQNENSISSAKSAIDTAKSAVAVQEASLNSITADPRDVDLQGVKDSIREAEAAYRLIATNRSKAFIRAPFSGVVSAIPLKENNLVGSGQTVVSLVNKDGLQVKAYISEKEKDLIENGAKVKIGDNVEGIVSNISPSINDITKKIEIIIPITSDMTSLTIGESVEPKISVKTDLSGSDKFLLPLKAIKFTSDKSYVSIVKDGLIEEREVKLGEISSESIEVLEGLNMDDRIIASNRGLKAGQKVTVKE